MQKLQQAVLTREKGYMTLTPLGATESPLDICRHRRNKQEETTEYIIASEDGSSQLFHSLALVTQPTLSNTEPTVFYIQ